MILTRNVANITPPVGVAPAAASGIAGGACARAIIEALGDDPVLPRPHGRDPPGRVLPGERALAAGPRASSAGWRRRARRMIT
jgi:hypothetical protein